VTTTKTWHLLPHDRALIERLAAELRLAPLVAQLLVNRGITQVEDAKRFLHAPFQGLHPPEQLPGAAAAAQRLYSAIQDKHRICIYGDYDVDGLTGTAILWQTLRFLGASADFYVPHRLDEGYGLHVDAIRQIAQSGAQLLVTVDCGITGVEEAAEARRLGLELIVTDHHEPKDVLPDAILVHPRLPGSHYPFGELSGSGVAFKVAWALCQLASGTAKVTPRFRDFLHDCVALAALGMVADVVPLLDENRIFVRHGLARLKVAASPGLQALLEVAGQHERPAVTTETVGFHLAPRMNAAGRLGCARLVVELLCTDQPPKAMELARFLDRQNQDRQTLERRILGEARQKLEDASVSKLPAIVLADAGWHPGVIGIVAGRLAEQHGKPALLVAFRDSGIGQGSGRSVAGFPLHEALRACDDLLLAHGGHAAAAGFKIAADKIDAFRERFCAFTASRIDRPIPPRIVLDAEVPLAAITHGFVNAVDHLEPYGAGNPRPKLLVGPVTIHGEPRKVGNGERHLQFRVKQQGTILRCIAFNHGERAEELMSAGGVCCLAATPSFNTWNNFKDVQLEVHDFQAGDRARLE